ncbi:hypothetical protein MATL_G00040120 [Megalops atlanticus]|uniref:Uncharacterized protein n=1 Tax=Megalops atlanticus TaxID=7932 RepID=A0A9D3Q9S9_MEGAT|nr:hypothetical protein MATL_G00040120 [Megalops atlanticus]
MSLIIMVSPLKMSTIYTVVFTLTTSVEAVKIIRAASGSFVHLPCPLAYNDSDTVLVNWTKRKPSSRCNYMLKVHQVST